MRAPGYNQAESDGRGHAGRVGGHANLFVRLGAGGYTGWPPARPIPSGWAGVRAPGQHTLGYQ